MIPVNISFENYKIRNIKFSELEEVVECINQNEDNIKALGRTEAFSIEDIKQRYIETLVNSMEFFCGIYYCDRLIGILKGRIEIKTAKELWILSLLLLEEYRKNGLGTKILYYFQKHFEERYAIDKIWAVMIEGNEWGQRFWFNNNFTINRITRSSKEKEPGIVVMEKKNKILNAK